MARPRSMSDAAILDAAERAIAAYGPAFSLESVARRLGVTPQAILHRFGSRHALVLAIASRRASAALEPERPSGPRRSPLRMLYAFFKRRLEAPDYTHRALAANFAFMLDGVANEAVRWQMLAQATALRHTLQELVEAAVQTHELRGNPNIIAKLVEATFNGAMILWLLDRQGNAWEFFEERLTMLLAPYRTTRRGGKAKRRHQNGSKQS